jgi:hypothetical protein
MTEIIMTFIFAVFESLQKLTSSRDLWALTLTGTLSIFVVFRLLTPRKLLVAVLFGVFGSWFLVKLQHLAPQEILMNLFGIQLPWFTMLSLVVPLIIAAVALIGTIVLPLRHNFQLGNVAPAIATLMIACNIGLLQNANIANIRSQDYLTSAAKTSYVLGVLFLEAIVLLPIPAIVGALNRNANASREKMLRILVSAFGFAGAGYVYWELRNILPLQLFYRIFGF